MLLVLNLLTIGVIGTLGEYGHLGHSIHLVAGVTTVGLVLTSAAFSSRIHPSRPWARRWHIRINGLLFLAFAFVSWTGWSVVQKYLP